MSTYVISDIHGAYDAYMTLKAAVNYDSKKDRLYIIGDIFDGNTRYPEDCLKILDDVIRDNSITLLWGNHELAHFEYYNACKHGRTDAIKVWNEYLSDPICGGSPLLEYFSRHKDKWNYYMDYLRLHPCFSELIDAEGEAFLLVHGAPVAVDLASIRNTRDIVSYQYMCLNNTPTFKEDLYAAAVSATALSPDMIADGQILTTNAIIEMFEKYGIKDIKCIVGHTPTKYLANKKSDLQKMYHKNDIYCIDCGCRANSLNNTYAGSIVGSDLCMMKLGKKPSFTYYSKIKKG